MSNLQKRKLRNSQKYLKKMKRHRKSNWHNGNSHRKILTELFQNMEQDKLATRVSRPVGDAAGPDGSRACTGLPQSASEDAAFLLNPKLIGLLSMENLMR